jgi:hypothetical protein
MALTTEQKATLKAAILADPTLNAFPNTSDGDFDLAVYLSNTLASPAFRVWRSDVPTADVKKAIVWTEYIGRSVGERGAFELMISNGIINASDVNVRQGIQDCFSGPSGAGTRTNLTNISKRDANLIEKILATGTGSDASPGTMTFVGTISGDDVASARNS